MERVGHEVVLEGQVEFEAGLFPREARLQMVLAEGEVPIRPDRLPNASQGHRQHGGTEPGRELRDYLAAGEDEPHDHAEHRIAYAGLNALGAGVILHVAIGRRWPFQR